MKQDIQNIIIGTIFVCISILVTSVAMLDTTTNLSNTYYAEFENADGIKNGTPVYFMGVHVGTTQNIQLKNGRVLVDIAVKKDIKIPMDSSLQIETPDLFSSKILNISAGFEENTLPNNGYFSTVQNSVDFLGLLSTYLDGRIKKAKDKKGKQ